MYQLSTKVRDRGGQGEFIKIGRETPITGKWELNLGREMGTEIGMGNGNSIWDGKLGKIWDGKWA